MNYCCCDVFEALVIALPKEGDNKMLCLSRKAGEIIVIGEGLKQVKITVVRINRGRVYLGLEAVPEIPIYRAELLGDSQPAPPVVPSTK
jgi:carbon storage regulator CsrA